MTKENNGDFQKFFYSLKNSEGLSFDLIDIKGCPVYPQFSFHKCHFKYKNIELVGTGEDFSSEVSQWKALGEVLERWPLLDTDFEWKLLSLKSGKSKSVEFKSSNGCAFHFKQEKALLGAKKEVYERHTVLEAWLEKKEVHEVKFKVVGKIQQYLNNQKNKVKSRTIYFKNNLDLPIFCTEIWGKDFRFYGYGADLNKEKALFKSYYEAWRFYWDYSKGKKREFTDGEDPCLHHYYYWLTNAKEEAFNVAHEIHFEEINSLNKLDYNEGEAYLCDMSQKGIHGYVYKVVDPRLIDLWVGPLTKRKGKREVGEYHPIA